MSTWYKTGTISVTNGSPTVTGTGTDWIRNAKVGDELKAPDDRGYEITGIVSATEMTVDPPYLGATQSGQAYKIKPTRGLLQEYLQAANEILSEIQPAETGPLAGLFKAGTQGAPGIGFQSDTDTGLWLEEAGILSAVTAGVRRMKLDATGLQLDVPLKGSAVQSAVDDETAGVAMLMGAFGLGAGMIEFEGDIDSVDLPTGFYRVRGAATGTKPTNDDGFTYDVFNMIVLRRLGGQASNSTQIAFCGSQVFTRQIAPDTTDWSWDQHARATDIQYGSGAGGEYVWLKTADVQLCWGAVQSDSAASVDWVYERPFKAGTTPRILCTSSNASLSRVATGASHDHASAKISLFNDTGGRTAAWTTVLAIGQG